MKRYIGMDTAHTHPIYDFVLVYAMHGFQKEPVGLVHKNVCTFIFVSKESLPYIGVFCNIPTFLNGINKS